MRREVRRTNGSSVHYARKSLPGHRSRCTFRALCTEVTMANSSAVRLVGIALGALAVAWGSCAAPIFNDAKLHLAAAPEDFKALGIGQEIEGREDGRRSPQSSEYFEW